MGGRSPVKKETEIIYFNDVTEEKIVMKKTVLRTIDWTDGDPRGTVVVWERVW